ncbi:H-NS histone family protein [Pseudomonas aeruginosa]|nr:H-NS histone family protein [Pseudomonas aeruginosa]MCT0870739.1 H-NS histone family protein [Pseudomonas aeruginosa]MCT0901171.1 H-NS histone family protein [Pseudomonas aeruginosa]MCT0925661.1 H-NS histone family protein [Pseudomonas aeruginosa]
MTESKICTCPSGDGSLVHPCQAHPAEQAEAERPEVVAYRTIGRHTKHQHPHYALNYYKQNAEDQAAHWRERGCEVSEDELMTVAQHERIVGALRAVITQLRQHKNDYMDAGQETYRALQNEIREREAEIARLDGLVSSRTTERDAALARVAELAQALRHLLHNIKASGKRIDLGLAKECAEDALARIDSTVAAQAQHSGPEEFSFEYRHPNGESHTVTVSRDQVINEMPDFLFEALCSKFCNCEPAGETNVVECCCDEYAEEFKLLAAAPAQAQHSVPEGWMLVPVEPLLNMMSDKDHDTRITAERQLLSILAAAPGNSAQHSVPEGWMLVECGIWTQEQVDEMQKTVTRFRNSEFVDDRALAMAVADAGQCKAPEISLAELLAAEPGKEGV